MELDELVISEPLDSILEVNCNQGVPFLEKVCFRFVAMHLYFFQGTIGYQTTFFSLLKLCRPTKAGIRISQALTPAGSIL